ncbi:acyltransferase family protein [Hymenobacter perfusus]|uniref:Acyltransferase n=1 Tax=Hymenobacter perfusus TaxID=1236770 RepID=A0A428K366_9BACT|nr:acyltransferase [Hymenobacter perfusus]RSK40833.1 acyltransferase [Hymenobacter perfusus]
MKEQRVLSSYMPALTGVRAIAAYMVYFHHFNPFTSYENKTGFLNLLYRLCDQMHVGVTLFFVLSGFLICFRYFNKVDQINPGWFLIYMKNRFARIYPVYFILTALTFGLMSLDNRLDFMGQYNGFSDIQKFVVFVLNITFVKGFFNGFKFTGIAQGWSLTVEECFYVFAPFVLLLSKKNKYAIIYSWVAVLALGFLLVLLFSKHNIFGFFESVKFMLNFTFFGRVTEFIFGIGLGIIALRIQKKTVLKEGIFTYFSLLGIGFVIYVMSCLGESEVSKNNFFGIFLNNVVLAAIVCLFFYGIISEKTVVEKILSSKIFDILGKSSYIFYLIHMGVFSILLKTYVTDNYLICFVLLNIASVILYTYLEKPLHKLLRPKRQV